MKKWSLTLTGVLSFVLAFGQNLHVAYRSKMTFPGQSVANIWGYTANGREYALIGASKGLIIADITNPDMPQQIVQIPGPNNLWKEIKTYRSYAYIVSEGGQGVQIVDLSKLPSPNLPYHFYTGDSIIQGQLGKIHALHIDVSKGFLYAYGGNLFSGGAKVLDLNADPYNPTYAGKFDQLGYIHDGYVDNDTLYSAQIYQGKFAVVDMTDKSNPQLINTQNTPNNFTHNTWLSDDRKTLFTTDETSNSFLASFDISDLDNIRLLDKIQSNPGSNSVVHNTHILGQYAVTAWYKDGFTITDVSRPDNLVQVGNFDTYPNGSGSGYEGCWGVYPYFPSGTIIASTINAQGTGDGELWVLTPTYVRACYLEGRITDGVTGNPLNAALIEVVGTGQTNTGADGTFKMGQEQDGYFVVRVSKNGYQTEEYTASFQRGKVCTFQTALYPTSTITVNGTVLDESTGAQVSNASVTFSSWSNSLETSTDPDGNFLVSNLPPGNYDIVASAAGYGQAVKFKQKITQNKTITLTLSSKSKGLLHPIPGPKSAALLWPNPFTTETEINLTPERGYCRIRAADQSGRLIGQWDAAADNAPIRLGKTWAPGIYIVHLDWANGETEVFKVIKSQ